MYTVWYSTESVADYFISKTALKDRNYKKSKLFESDANNPRLFHTLPDHIKRILYLDAPDLIVELDSEPIFSVEISTEAGTGHNAFQRFARLAASVENDVPAFYVYPDAKVVSRDRAPDRWDRLNPLILLALEEVMRLYDIPALFYAFPTHFKADPLLESPQSLMMQGLKYEPDSQFSSCPLSDDPEMKLLFQGIDEVVEIVETNGPIKGRQMLLKSLVIRARRTAMAQMYAETGGDVDMSPLTSIIAVDTQILLDRLSLSAGSHYEFGRLLPSRKESVIYCVNAKFRGDPYPGCLAAIDYLKCRQGRTFEDRRSNLVIAFGEVSLDGPKPLLNVLPSKQQTVDDFVSAVRSSETKNLLATATYSNLSGEQIPRYYMQCRYGSTFSKVKHIRVYSYFADAILFPDGSFWRDG